MARKRQARLAGYLRLVRATIAIRCAGYGTSGPAPAIGAVFRGTKEVTFGPAQAVVLQWFLQQDVVDHSMFDDDD